MRSYPRNSPEAAGRIVALVLLSDGHVCSSEIQALDRVCAARRLGLSTARMTELMQTLCEELFADAYTGMASLGGVDDDTLATLLGEVDDRELQHRVLEICHAAAAADSHLADSEARLIEAAYRHWDIAPPPAGPARMREVLLEAA